MGACTCEYCVGACHNVPGWFMPGQVEKLAKRAKLSLLDYFTKFLVLEYWVNGDSNIYVLTPSKSWQTPGTKAKWNSAYHPGKCIFLDDKDRCSIHKFKPFECAKLDCSKVYSNPRRRIALVWKKFWVTNEQLLEDLLRISNARSDKAGHANYSNRNPVPSS